MKKDNIDFGGFKKIVRIKKAYNWILTISFVVVFGLIVYYIAYPLSPFKERLVSAIVGGAWVIGASLYMYVLTAKYRHLVNLDGPGRGELQAFIENEKMVEKVIREEERRIAELRVKNRLSKLEVNRDRYIKLFGK